MNYSILDNFEKFNENSEERKVICLNMNHEASLKLGINSLPSLAPCTNIKCGSYKCFSVLLERKNILKGNN
jgi:hypothetical protein